MTQIVVSKDPGVTLSVVAIGVEETGVVVVVTVVVVVVVPVVVMVVVVVVVVW